MGRAMSRSVTTTDSSPQTDVQPANDVKGFFSDETLASYETWLDSKFQVPVIGVKVGLDGVIGLIPGIGDLLTTGVSAVFVADAWKSGARKRTLAKMVGNVGVDFAVGAIPVVGDLFDFAFKSNTKNLRLLQAEREHLRNQTRETA